MIIKFDNTTIDSDNIIELTQQADVFDSYFKLGSTICNAFTMSVMKDAVSSVPSIVTLNDDSNNVLYTLNVDNINDENDDYYTYTLVDNMVKYNVNYDWSELVDQSAQGVLNAICAALTNTIAPTITYGGSIVVAYDGKTSARQFISYIAEINGSIARINASGTLEFVAYSNDTNISIEYDTCEDISIGEAHTIKNVFVELGSASHRYPSTEVEGDTVYVDSGNILLTDSGSFTIDGILQHIHSVINNFTFYNLSISRCEFPQDLRAGDVVKIDYGNEALETQDGYVLITQSGDTIVTQNKYIPFIANVDWAFYKEWFGGFDLNVENTKQEETNIIEGSKQVKSLKITVDRELGAITQRISDDEGNISQLQQTAESLDTRFVSTSSNLATNIKFDINGVTISTDNETDTSLNLNNNGVYIKDQSGNDVSTMTSTEFTTGEWIMQQSGDAFSIFKRH